MDNDVTDSEDDVVLMDYWAINFIIASLLCRFYQEIKLGLSQRTTWK